MEKICQSKKKYCLVAEKKNLSTNSNWFHCLQMKHYILKKERLEIFMSENIARCLHTLPIELVYLILDELDDRNIFLSCYNVCTRLNAIIDSYHRYQVKNISFGYSCMLWINNRYSRRRDLHPAKSQPSKHDIWLMYSNIIQ